MELPISVMIILFVAIVVGIAVIGFANMSLERASDDLRSLGKNNPERFEDKLVDVPTLTGVRIKSLGSQCVKDLQGFVSEELCFVVRSLENYPGGIQEIEALNGEIIEINDNNWEFRVEIQGSPNVLFIYYNPVGRIHVIS